MNFLIDIGHPAHVHLFRNLYFEFKKKKHRVLVTTKDVAIVKRLLSLYRIPFLVIGKKSDSLLGKLTDQLWFDKVIWSLCRRFSIDIALGSSINITHISRISRVQSFVFDDDDSAVQPLMAWFGHPFSDYVVSPDVLDYERKKANHLTYPGYHELAYLHPNRFQPDPNVLKEAGLTPGERFFLMRFNAFKAHHDVGVTGLSIEQKERLIERLSREGKVIITTERNIEKQFLPYQITVSPEKAHSLLYYATMLIGDSQTMTSEAAVLGTPSLRCNSFAGRISYLEEEEKKYGLTFGFLPSQFSRMQEKMEELLASPHLKAEWKRKRSQMLQDKIDVTAFMAWLFEHFPESIEQTKSDPTVFDQFKLSKVI
jgi:predicted glycosyltransferase